MSPWSDPNLSRLPGILPLQPDDWLLIDDAYAGQMAERDRLLSRQRGDVLQLRDCAKGAAGEILTLVLEILKAHPEFEISGEMALRPDGIYVAISYDDPLGTLGHLVQEDFCILQEHEDGHMLTGAILCFPASWTLAEKMDRPLIGIHSVVDEYDEDVSRRVQRLFDAIRPGRPLWRANAHFYDDPALYSPRLENDKRPVVFDPAPYIRSERQCMLRLPKTNAVVFSIHTFLVRHCDLTTEQASSIGRQTPSAAV